jgi:two-component system sensor histidine kinase RegB
MGLGLFIAKTLLERSGAELTFANGTDPMTNVKDHSGRSGAIVEVTWPRELVESNPGDIQPLGENRPIEA